MKYLLSLVVALASCGLAALSTSTTNTPKAETTSTATFHATVASIQDQDQEKPQPGLTSNQALMRDKLKHMSQILNGLTMDNFEQVAENAVTLAMISRATSWHIAEPTAKYQRLSKNFQEQARDLERHALEKNLEAATLDLVRMNISCTECHQHMREHLGIAK
ncbi:MAG: hypothetical protein JNL67_01820 [Planctomycetaceae bacterium]|nr:hypothetical protein [Planctomycetaceae bacterium]